MNIDKGKYYKELIKPYINELQVINNKLSSGFWSGTDTYYWLWNRKNNIYKKIEYKKEYVKTL